jgi:hypothetical protein
MLSSGANVVIWDQMLSSRMKCYNQELLGQNVITRDEMLQSRANVILWDEMLSSKAIIVNWDKNDIIWDEMLPSGMKCYHLG